MNDILLCPSCFEGKIEEGTCPLCDYPEGAVADPDVLPVGTLLDGRYKVGKVLGRGGFGITYLGVDTRLKNKKVAIKEFYPENYAYREQNGNSHSVRSYALADKRTVYESGMEHFKQEAASLAEFSKIPGVVDVTDYFSEYDTYYIVMEFIDGDKLETALKYCGHMSEETAFEIFIPIIEALVKMHKKGIIHRDISPNNIMLERETGLAYLIDFGSASQCDNNDGRTAMATQPKRYTPEEVIIGERSRQGAWTDVYSLCATMYKALTGITPLDPIARLRGETLPSLSAEISEATRRAIENGLIVLHDKRTQSMEQLLAELQSAAVQNPAPAEPPKTEPVMVEKTEPVPPPKAESLFLCGNPLAEANGTPPKTEPVTPETPKRPPAKTFTYLPPCYDGLTLGENIDYAENGDICAHSHSKDGNPDGFMIIYTPDSNIIVTYPTKEGIDKQPLLLIKLDESDYGNVYISESVELFNEQSSGEMYFMVKYNYLDCAWITSRDGEIDTAYRFDGEDVFVSEMKDGKEVSDIKLQVNNGLWQLGEDRELFFVNANDYIGFVNSKFIQHYFGTERTDDSSYRGQFVDGKKTGLGITKHTSGDVFIGLYNENDEVYGLYYFANADKSYFVKNVNNKALTAIGEIKGMNIDYKKLFS
jgi:serine/threonine protein kinase